MEKYKYKSTIYLVFLLVSLFINAVLLYMLIAEDKKDVEKVDDPIISINKDELVSEAMQVYQSVYDIFNSEESNFYIKNYEGKRWGCVLINFNGLDEYFTTKAIAELSKNLNFENGIYTDCKNILKTKLSHGLFGSFQQRVRELKYVASGDDTLIVSGKLEYDGYVNSDTYPLYMMLKYEDNKWKIDQFE